MARHRTEDVVVLMRMGQGNGAAHLIPLAHAVHPARLRVVRPAPRPPHLRLDNLDYVEVAGGPKAWEVIKAAVATFVAVVRSRPSLVASFNAYPYGILALLIGILTRTPVHIGFVGSDIKKLGRVPPLLRLLSNASLVTAPGTTTACQLTEAGLRTGVRVLTHGVDETRFHPGPLSRDIDVAYLGALIPLKRVELMIDAVRILHECGRPVRCVVIGDGIEKESLVRRTVKSGLIESVEFVGHQAEPEQWLRRTKCLVMPSEWEGLAFALIEAMRCGVIPLVSEVASTPDLVRHDQNGILLDRNSVPADIAAELSRLLDDPARMELLSMAAVTSTHEFTFARTTNEWRQNLALVRGGRT